MLRLLLVEDDHAYARLVAIALEEIATIVSEPTLREAVALGGRGIDVVLCDLNLPDAEGAEIVSALVSGFPDATVVATSGADGPHAEAALRAGAHAFVLKGGELDGRLRAAIAAAGERTSAVARRRAGDGPALPAAHADRVAAAPVAMLGLDAGGGCTWTNARFDALTGIAPSRARGTGWLEGIHPADRRGVLERWHVQSAAGTDVTLAFRLAHPDGRILHLTLTAAPVPEPAGRPTAWTAIVLDETQRRTAERELAHREAQLHGVIDASPNAILLEDPAGRPLLSNPAADALLPPDREALLSGTRDVLATGAPRQEELTTDRDGAARTWLATRFPVRDADDVLTGVGVIASDVTERRRLEAQLRLIFDQAPIGLALTDLQGHWVRVNPAACTMLGRRAAELLGSRVDAVVHPDDRDVDAEALARVVAGELEAYEIEKRCLRPDGSRLWVVFSVSAVPGPDGRARQIVLQLLDMTVRRDLEARLTELADVDAVTGLPNERRLRAELERAITWRRRSGEHATLVLLEIVGGAPEGVLRELGGLLRRTVRRSDILVRAEGDRFALLLPGTTAAAAAIVVGKLEQSIGAAGLGVPAFGVVELGSSGVTPDEILRDAAAALVAAGPG